MFYPTNNNAIWLFDPTSRVGLCQDKLITIVSVFCPCNQPSHRQTFPSAFFCEPHRPTHLLFILTNERMRQRAAADSPY